MGSEQVNGATQSTTQTTRSSNERKMSDAMKESSKITQSQLASLLDIDINTVKYYVRNLSKERIIEHKGSNRNGEWVVLDC